MRRLLLKLALKSHVYRPLRTAHTHLFRSKEFKINLLFYKNLVKPGCLVFDVGANRGQSAELFMRAGARVVAFEPQAQLHPEIRQRCQSLGQLILEPLALGKRVESRSFYLRAFDEISSMRRDWGGEIVATTEVAVSTLDTKIREHGKPHYCKIDVEGWELEVLSGLSVVLPLISFEFHLSEKEISNTLGALRRIEEIGQYKCNIRQADDAVFLIEDFLDMSGFIKFFREYAVRSPNSVYGEIFAKAD